MKPMKPHRIVVPGKQKPRPTPILMFANQVFQTDDSAEPDEQLTTTYQSAGFKIQRGKYIMHFF